MIIFVRQNIIAQIYGVHKMEWVLYFAVGAVVTVILLLKMKINWRSEGFSTKFLIIVTPFAWPLVLVFIVVVAVVYRK